MYSESSHDHYISDLIYRAVNKPLTDLRKSDSDFDESDLAGVKSRK